MTDVRNQKSDDRIQALIRFTYSYKFKFQLSLQSLIVFLSANLLISDS